MTTTTRRILPGLYLGLMAFALTASAQQQMPQTTKQRIAGQAAVKTEHLSGTVVFVEGNRLVVSMSTGGVRTFEVPESRRFIIDGKELTVGELKTGTKLTATVTTTTTPITERTTTIGTGKVWWVSGNTVIITLPNNENRMYKVKEDYRFNIGGQKASVHELRKGMVIAAEKIVEEPKTEVASNVAVTGHAPPPPRAAEIPAPAPVRTKPSPVASAAPAPAPRPVQEAERAAPPPPAKLPKTASDLPLVGMLGLTSICASLFLRKLRH